MNECGLTRSQIGALMEIYHKGHCPVTTIGHDLGITTAAASQLVDRLVNIGLMERTEDTDDRRVKIVTLSEEGAKLLNQGLDARLGWVEELASVIPLPQQQEIIEALKTLVGAAQIITKNPELTVK
jgi:DNA-binding MarR family transcriptional regulator